MYTYIHVGYRLLPLAYCPFVEHVWFLAFPIYAFLTMVKDLRQVKRFSAAGKQGKPRSNHSIGINRYSAQEGINSQGKIIDV